MAVFLWLWKMRDYIYKPLSCVHLGRVNSCKGNVLFKGRVLKKNALCTCDKVKYLSVAD